MYTLYKINVASDSKTVHKQLFFALREIARNSITLAVIYKNLLIYCSNGMLVRDRGTGPAQAATQIGVLSTDAMSESSFEFSKVKCVSRASSDLLNVYKRTYYVHEPVNYGISNW